MTETRYLEPLTSFALTKCPEPWYEVNIMKEGKAALQKVNDHLGKPWIRSNLRIRRAARVQLAVYCTQFTFILVLNSLTSESKVVAQKSSHITPHGSKKMTHPC